MMMFRCAVCSALILPFVWCCQDDGPGPVPPPVPVGLRWGSGASGAMVEDTVPLVVFFRDSAGDPIGWNHPAVSWTSSNPAVLRIYSETLAIAVDTGTAVLTATTATPPIDTLRVSLEVIPRWQGRLVWSRQPGTDIQPGIALQELPNHEVLQLPDLGYPGSGSGDASLSFDGRRVAATATRTISPIANRTIVLVDLVTGERQAPFDSLPGNQFAAVWLPGDTLLAFLMGATTGYEVFTARRDGTGVQQQTHLSQFYPPLFDVTPEGSIVTRLGSGTTSDLFELTMTGDTIRRVTSTVDYEETSPATSPDGAMIVYVATLNGSGFSHVWLMNRDGTNAHRLLPEVRKLAGSSQLARPASSGSPSWTPDSKFVLVTWHVDSYLRSDGLAYESLGDLYAIRLSDGLAFRLTRSPHADAQPVFR